MGLMATAADEPRTATLLEVVVVVVGGEALRFVSPFMMMVPPPTPPPTALLVKFMESVSQFGEDEACCMRPAPIDLSG